MSKSLNISADIKNWPRIYDFIVDYFLEQKILKKNILGMLISAEEIFSNIINHAQVEANSEINVQIDYLYSGKAMSLVFEYAGIKFDPSGAGMPDVSKSPKERRTGGLGLLIVKKFTDNMTYSYIDGKNILQITKRTVNF